MKYLWQKIQPQGLLRFLGAPVLALFVLGSVTACGNSGDGSTDSKPGGKKPGKSGDPAKPDIPKGTFTDPEDPSATLKCDVVNPGDAPLRRLSHAEYRNVLADLLGEDLRVKIDKISVGFTEETLSLGFRNNADFLKVPQLVAEQYEAAAEKLSRLAVTDSGLTKCDGDKSKCGAAFIEDFGFRAFRRPLSKDEKSRLVGLFEKALADNDYETGIEWTLYAMLQSPNFLYRAEIGQKATDGVARPTHFEMANRLSFLLWQSMPDETLFKAAENGELGTAKEVKSQAERMMEDPKADRALEFYAQWLDTDQVGEMKRDSVLFKGIPSNLPALFAQEMHAFTRALVFDDNGTFSDLMTAPYTFVNAELASHYGIEGDFGADFERVDRPGASGVLTTGGFITVHDKPNRTSIVRRGVKLRTDMMCQLVPAPPNDVQLDLEGLSKELTQKERLELHSKEPSCAGCHVLMDDLGLAFENLDAVGRFRDTDEDGNPVNTQSEITESEDADGKVSGPEDVGKMFAKSEQVSRCFVDQNFRFFYGRDYSDEDKCSRARLMKSFKDAEFSLRSMLVGMTQTDAFLFMPEVKQ